MQFLAYITSDKMSETLILWMIDAGNTEAVSGPLKRWISLVFFCFKGTASSITQHFATESRTLGVVWFGMTQILKTLIQLCRL